MMHQASDSKTPKELCHEMMSFNSHFANEDHCCLSKNDLTLLHYHSKPSNPEEGSKENTYGSQHNLLIDKRKVRNYRNGWKDSPPFCKRTHTCTLRPTNRHGKCLMGIMFLALLQLLTKQVTHEMVATSGLEPVELY